MRVVKNTLARKAVSGTTFECIGPQLKGPLILAFSKDDPGAAARVIKAFAKDNDKLVATLVSLGGQVLPAKSLDQIASLPTREQALSMLLGVLKAPISKFVAYARRAARQAGSHRRCGEGSEGGRRGLTHFVERFGFKHSSLKDFLESTEMAANKEEILNTIANMTILEVVDLVKMMEEKFGVTAAAPMAMAAAAPAAAAAAPVEAQTEFTVVLKEYPADKKVTVIKVVREADGPGPQGSQGSRRGRAVDGQGGGSARPTPTRSRSRSRTPARRSRSSKASMRGLHTAPDAERTSGTHPAPARLECDGRASVLAGLIRFRADPISMGSATRGRLVA